jgi:predicted DNA-binding protein
MNNLLSKLNSRYIIDKYGKKTHIILGITKFEKLLTELEDLYFGAIACKTLSKEKDIISHEDVKKTQIKGKNV